jgi:aryl-alcohol dehydrogenase-like predicted oxidoreductase
MALREAELLMDTKPTAAAAGTIDVGGDLTVNRLGFGAMRITGQGVWGEPPDRDRAKAALRRAVELDVTFIDTADSYGPDVSETLIAEALYPYPDELVRSPQILPIPGTGSAEHVEENVRAASLELSPEEIASITGSA